MHALTTLLRLLLGQNCLYTLAPILPVVHSISQTKLPNIIISNHCQILIPCHAVSIPYAHLSCPQLLNVYVAVQSNAIGLLT